MRPLLPAAALAVLLAAPARADIVFLNGGEELSGAVERADAGGVVLRADGRERTIPTAQVLKVKLVRVWGVPGEDKAADVSDPALRELLKSPPKPADYPDDGSLTYLDDKSCDIGADGRAVCRRRVIRVVLREREKSKAANVRFYYLSGAETGAIDWARSVNGANVSNLDDTSVERGSEYSQYPAYDRLKSVKFSIPDVATGTVLDYRYRIESAAGVSTEPFTASMYFRGFEPAARIRFSVTAPKGLALSVVERGLPKDAVVRREDLGARVRRTWEVRGVPAFKSEDQMPPYARFAPYVEVAPAATWAGVAAAAGDAVRARLDPGPDLRAQAAAIVAGRRTDAEKVEALYDWVARRIKYQGVMMDAYAYEPKSPEEILAAKAGNALDKPFLLFAMLREAGFRPQLAFLMNKGARPFQESLPTLDQFSAAAVALDLDGRRLLLTPFEDTRRWRETPSWLQDVHGLIVFGPEAGKTFLNPLTDARDEGETDRLRLTLAADGALSGSATLSPVGEGQAGWRALKDWKKQDVDREFEQIAHAIHPNARLVSYAIDGLDDPTRDLVVRLSFAIKDYALTASGGYMAFRLPWVGGSAGDVGKPERELPMFWHSLSREVKEMSVALPRGYRLYYAPPAASLDGPGTSYRASYAPGRGELAFTEESERAAPEVSPRDYPRYKTYREAVARWTQRWIVLKKGR